MFDLSRALNFCWGAKILAAVAICALSLFNSGCQSDEDANQPPVADVSGITVKAQIRRFDHDLFAADTTQWAASMQALGAKYPAFLPFFIREIAHDQTQPQETPEAALYGFATAPQVRRLNDSVQVAFPNLDAFQKELAQLLRYYKHYCPQAQEPVTIAAVTEFVGDAFMVNDTTLMLGLDMFLGTEFEGYNPEIFPQYMRNQFTPEHMIVKCAFALANNALPPPAQDYVMDHVIRNGKVLYLMDCMLPTVPDSTLMGYTAEELSGCFANEKNLWARLLEMKVLYEPLGTKNMKLVTAGPSTDNVFREAPGQVGNWLGWQIVRAYMKRYPQTSIAKLGQLTDAQEFLQEAKYKPRG